LSIIQQKPNEAFENGYLVVNDLLEQLDVTDCSHAKRSILEWMGNENKDNRYPTNREIAKIRGISPDHTKRLTGLYKKEGLIVPLKTKGPHGTERLALANILVEEDLEYEIAQPLTGQQIVTQLSPLKEFFNNENYLLHNIHLLAYLKGNEIYKKILGTKSSDKNQGKTFNRRLHPNRRFSTITFYPNCSIDISISCSTNPYDLTTIDGVANFHSAIGQILQMIIDITDTLNPLTTEPAEWEFTQCDINLDISGNRWFEWSPGFRLKIKDLSHLYQFYNKTTINGRVTRFEDKKTFPPNQRPTVRDMEKAFLNKQIDNVLDRIGIKDLDDPSGPK
jgi:hypothetical protein